jgi:uncharacterized protein
MMRSAQITWIQIRALFYPILERYQVEKAILFGSFATGHPSRHSDVDVILITKTEKRFFDRYEGILRDLNRAIRGRAVEAFIYTPEELDLISHRPFIARAMKEGKVIYESGKTLQ